MRDLAVSGLFFSANQWTSVLDLSVKNICLTVYMLKRIFRLMLADADLVVTVCGHADEHCPVLPAVTNREHWPLGDSAKHKVVKK